MALTALYFVIKTRVDIVEVNAERESLSVAFLILSYKETRTSTRTLLAPLVLEQEWVRHTGVL